MKREIKIISLLIGLIFLTSSIFLFPLRFSYAASKNIASGTYDGVPWVITKSYELKIGKSKKTTSFENRKERTETDWPWFKYRDKIVSVKVLGTVNGAGSLDYMFYGCKSMSRINISNIDTSDVTSMFGMFYECSSLSKIDVSKMNTANVNHMGSMFCKCEKLKKLNLSNFDTRNVANMKWMFAGCKKLTGLDISSFNTENVKDMSYMFYWCSSLKELDVSNFNTSNVINMGLMFSNCSSIESLDVSRFDTGNVTMMNGMFEACKKLCDLNLSSFNTKKVQGMGMMFTECNSLQSLDLSSFDTKNVSNMFDMFAGCFSLIDLNVSSFETGNVTDMMDMFSGCKALKRLDLSGFDTRNVDNMLYMFDRCEALTDIVLGANSFFSVDPPNTTWTRYKTATGGSADGPIYANLSDYDGKNPGAYRGAAYVYYEVRYDANGGQNAPKAQSGISGEPITISSVAPVRSGYTFKGWGTNRSSIAASYMPGGTYYGNTSIVLYAIWVNNEGAQPPDSTPVTPPSGAGLEIGNLSYGFGNNAASFGYEKGYHIPLTSYQIVFGQTTKAKVYYNQNLSKSWGGNCNGIASTSALLYDTSNNVIPSSFKNAAKSPLDLKVSDASSALKINVTQFIEAMQISQYTQLYKDARNESKVETADINAGRANLNDLYNTLKTNLSKGSPVILAVCVRGMGGHAILAYKIEEITADQSRLYVYDSNYPDQERYFQFGKNKKGDWDSWSYEIGGAYGVWGTDNENSYLSIIPYSVISRIWETRGKLEEDEVNAFLNVDDIAVYDSNNKLVAMVYDGQLVSANPDIYMMSDDLSLGSGNENHSIALAMPVDVYRFKSLEKNREDLEITTVNTHLSANVSTTAQDVTIAVDDSCNLDAVYMDASAQDTYSVTLNSSYAYDSNEVFVEGKGNGESLEISQSKGTLNVSNCDVGIILLDGREVTPDRPVIKKASGSGKKMKVSWKQQSGVTGYQIQYALDKKFSKGKKSVTVNNGTASSKVIKGLKKGKNYYVRIRAWKTVSKEKYYSIWSKTNKVRIK